MVIPTKGRIRSTRTTGLGRNERFYIGRHLSFVLHRRDVESSPVSRRKLTYSIQ